MFGKNKLYIYLAKTHKVIRSIKTLNKCNTSHLKFKTFFKKIKQKFKLSVDGKKKQQQPKKALLITFLKSQEAQFKFQK